MIIALQIVAGVALTGAVVSIFIVLAAFELGRLVTRDHDQREVELTADERPLRVAA